MTFNKKAYSKEYLQRPEIKARRKIYFHQYNQRPEIKEKRKEHMQEYNQKSEVIARRKKYDLKHKERFRKRKNKYLKNYFNNRYKIDINFKIGIRLRTLLCQALNHFSKTGKIMSAKKYGIDYEAIIKHLKPFPKNITNHHVDHIIPLVLFDLNNPEHIKKAFAPENHQWLTVQQNIAKGGRLVMPCA